MTADISVIIPTGGINRDKYLDSVTKNLRNTVISNSLELILVETGDAPRVSLETRSLFDTYQFSKKDGAFNLSLARNIGGKISNGNLLVFYDNDLLCQDDFLIDIKKNDSVRYQVGTTWNKVIYLDMAMSKEITTGNAGLNDVSPKNILGCYDSSEIHGGSIWINRKLFFAVKGFDESFDGWGCEDDAFWLKVSSVTDWKSGSHSKLFHLYHDSCGIDIKNARKSNPKYEFHRQRLEKMYQFKRNDWRQYIRNIKLWGKTSIHKT